jgi:hypothetical protein
MKLRSAYVLLFLVLSVVYHSNLRPIPSGDTLCTALLPFSILLDHTVTLDRFAPWLLSHVSYAHNAIRFSHGHYYSGYPMGGALLATPLYFPLLMFPGLRHWEPGSLVALARILEKFAATAIAAFSAVALLALLKRLTTTAWAWRLTLVYALGTSTWSIASQAMWQHTTGELAIIGSLQFLETWYHDRGSRGALWLCGACTACAVLVRPSNIIILPALGAAFLVARATRMEYVRWLALPVVMGLALFGYNVYMYRVPTGTYTLAMWQGSVLEGLMGLVFSPGRGVLIYMPIVLFSLCALLPAAAVARRKHAPLLVACVAFSALQYLVAARVTGWWGGYCWGPRFLTELIPPVVILMALGTAVLERPWCRRSFAALAVYCFLIQAVGAYFYPEGHWDHVPHSVDGHPERLWNWRDNPIGRTLAAGPAMEPFAIVSAALRGGSAGAARKMQELGVQLY